MGEAAAQLSSSNERRLVALQGYVLWYTLSSLAFNKASIASLDQTYYFGLTTPSPWPLSDSRLTSKDDHSGTIGHDQISMCLLLFLWGYFAESS